MRGTEIVVAGADDHRQLRHCLRAHAVLAAPRAELHGPTMTTVHVDGDVCPVREDVFHVATRLGPPVTVVDNSGLAARPGDLPKVCQVLVAATGSSHGSRAATSAVPEAVALTP
jgi:hypothetical protein